MINQFSFSTPEILGEIAVNSYYGKALFPVEVEDLNLVSNYYEIGPFTKQDAFSLNIYKDWWGWRLSSFITYLGFILEPKQGELISIQDIFKGSKYEDDFCLSLKNFEELAFSEFKRIMDEKRLNSDLVKN